MSIFLKGLFWGSFLFLYWPITFAIGLVLGIFFRYWGVILGFLFIDILFLSNNNSFLIPELPFTAISILILFVGTFLEKHLWVGKDSY